MTRRILAVAFASFIAAAPAAATQSQEAMPSMAPSGTEWTQYCMRVTVTGTLAEPIACMTRAEWADQGVDVDKEWAKEGVRTRG